MPGTAESAVPPKATWQYVVLLGSIRTAYENREVQQSPNWVISGMALMKIFYYGFRARPDVQLFIDMFEMAADGVVTDGKFAGDLLGHITLG